MAFPNILLALTIAGLLAVESKNIVVASVLALVPSFAGLCAVRSFLQGKRLHCLCTIHRIE